MERETRLELATSSLEGMCENPSAEFGESDHPVRLKAISRFG
jgi:hypothetical protein